MDDATDDAGKMIDLWLSYMNDALLETNSRNDVEISRKVDELLWMTETVDSVSNKFESPSWDITI